VTTTTDARSTHIGGGDGDMRAPIADLRARVAELDDAIAALDEGLP
jgi:hypothetical protein